MALNLINAKPATEAIYGLSREAFFYMRLEKFASHRSQKLVAISSFWYNISTWTYRLRWHLFQLEKDAVQRASVDAHGATPIDTALPTNTSNDTETPPTRIYADPKYAYIRGHYPFERVSNIFGGLGNKHKWSLADSLPAVVTAEPQACING
jgi:hypothetical protein